MSEKPQRIEILTQLRGFSILFILLYHYVLEISHFAIRPRVGNFTENFNAMLVFPWSYRFAIFGNIFSIIASLGWQFVGVFLFLSGFGLTYSRLSNPLQKNFFLKRLKRLVPGWHVAITFALVINFLSLHTILKDYLISSPSLMPLNYLHAYLFPIIIDYGLKFIPAINPSLWFIMLIFQFYILFEPLYLLMKKIKVKGFLILSLLITIVFRGVIVYFFRQHPISQFGINGWDSDLFNTLPARLLEFSLGMVAAWFAKNNIDWINRINLKVFLIGLLGWCLGNYLTWNIWGWIFSDLILTISLVVISIFILKSFKVRVVTNYFNLVGENSLFVYLFHNQPITQILAPTTYLFGTIFKNFLAFYLLSIGIIIFGLVPLCKLKERFFRRG